MGSSNTNSTQISPQLQFVEPVMVVTERGGGGIFIVVNLDINLLERTGKSQFSMQY